MTEEEREQMMSGTRTPKAQAKSVAGLRAWAGTKAGKEHLAIMQHNSKTPAALEKMAYTHRELAKTLERRKHLRAMQKASQTPEARNRMSETHRKLATTEEGKDIVLKASHSRTPKKFAKTSGVPSCFYESEVGNITKHKQAALHRKLTQEQADTIRRRVANGEKRKMLAKEYCVSKATIDNVVNRKYGY